MIDDEKSTQQDEKFQQKCVQEIQLIKNWIQKRKEMEALKKEQIALLNDLKEKRRQTKK